jgi:hypothetical protein
VKRLVALAIAAALVVAAVIVRGVIDGDDDGASGDGGARSEQVVCAEEVRAACEAIGGRVEDAAVTAAALSTADASRIDTWVVPEPWPGIVDDTRARAGLEPMFAEPPVRVARSALVAVGPRELDGCDWRCIGDRATTDVRLGGRDPSSGLGSLVVGALAAGWFGTADFAANDFDSEFTSWLASVIARIDVVERPVTRLLQGPFFDVALSFEAEAKAELDVASTDRSEGLALLYPAPVAYLDVVVAGDGSAGTRDEVAGALAAAGWGPASAEASGMPRPGVLVALRGLL